MLNAPRRAIARLLLNIASQLRGRANKSYLKLQEHEKEKIKGKGRGGGSTRASSLSQCLTTSFPSVPAYENTDNGFHISKGRKKRFLCFLPPSAQFCFPFLFGPRGAGGKKRKTRARAALGLAMPVVYIVS